MNRSVGGKQATSSLRRTVRCFSLVVGFLAMRTPPAQAQTVVQVIDGRSGNPVPQALIQSDSLSRGYLTDIAGRTVLPIRAGDVTISALSYRTTTVSLNGTVQLEVRLEPVGLELDSLVVDIDQASTGRAIFSERRARGQGIFLDPGIVQLKIKHRVSDLFYDLEGVRGQLSPASGERIPVSTLGTGCFAYLLNSKRVPTDGVRDPWRAWPLSSLTPEDIMAVEIYRYIGEVPPELRRFAEVDLKLCGLIVIWAREAW